jgi:hypothetical protein
MVKIFLQILNVFLLGACTVKYKPLDGIRTNFNGTEIKTNGYFLSEVCDSFFVGGRSEKTGSNGVFLLYKNGIFFYLNGYTPPADFQQVEAELLRIKNTPILRRMGLGIFHVHKNEINIERWTFASSSPVPIAISKGKILNDSTILIELFRNPCIWHFKHFPIKPDSTNIFIK